MKYGLVDTKDGLWMGDDNGPAVFDTEVLAKIAAQLLDEQLGQALGRTRAKPYDDTKKRKVDEVASKMTPLEALRRIEGSADQPAQEIEVSFDRRTNNWHGLKLVN
jgi:hypothetical protein